MRNTMIKKSLFKFFTICLGISLLAVSPMNYASTPMDTSIAPMLKKALPSVVNIRAQIKVTDFNQLRELQKQRAQQTPNGETLPIPNTFVSIGSGVIVDAKNGYILTNAHVVADAQVITITLGDGHHYTAKIIGADKPSDIAVIQIKAKNIVAIPFSNSDNVKVGDFVAAIGNPFGLNQSVTSGIVSALGRTTLGIESYENFIQTDAPINQGNSGGALIDMNGELIGINTAILATDRGNIGIGFAIPSNMAKLVMEQILQYGNVKRGVLGASVQTITPELGSGFHLDSGQGAAVAQVLPLSPANLGGLEVNDVITAINGHPIKTASDVINIIGFLRVDSTIKINVLRNNKPKVLTVTLSDPKIRQLRIIKNDPLLFGLSLKNFNIYSPIHGEVKGILVVGVEQDSPSWRSDLHAGDIITSANQQKISSLEELRTIAAKTDKELMLNVIRGPGALFIVLHKEEA